VVAASSKDDENVFGLPRGGTRRDRAGHRSSLETIQALTGSLAAAQNRYFVMAVAMCRASKTRRATPCPLLPQPQTASDDEMALVLVRWPSICCIDISSARSTGVSQRDWQRMTCWQLGTAASLTTSRARRHCP
jgi:hypothetical protein